MDAPAGGRVKEALRARDAALRESSGAQRLERREEEVRVVDPFRGVCDALCDMSFKGISMKVV
jgi:hypothetical protein